MRSAPLMLAGLALGLAPPALAQQLPKTAPGTPNLRQITAGTYTVDPAHSQIAFTVNHLGFSHYRGIFGNLTGKMTMDPKAPARARVSIDIPIRKVVTTVDELNTQLLSDAFFDAARYPTAHFEATSIRPMGRKARIAGNLTLKGITRPVVLDATFVGAGVMMGKRTVGFDATTTIKRSEFNIMNGIPLIPDEVPLTIAVAFEKSE